jgi:beta-lactamase class A
MLQNEYKNKMKRLAAFVLAAAVLAGNAPVSGVGVYAEETGTQSETTTTSETATTTSEVATTTTETATTTQEVTTTQSTTTKAESTTQKPKKTVLKGWVKKKKKTYYYVKGEKVTGWKTIKGKKYYFNESGVLQTSKMISKNKYVNEKGVLVDKSKIYSYQKKGLSGLQKKLSSMKSHYGGSWSIYVKNLDTNEYCLINNKVQHPASMIKLFAMASTFDRIEKGKLKQTSSVNSWLHSMITVSSNDSFNQLLKQNGSGSYSRGIDAITAFCKKQGYTETSIGGTLSPSYMPSYHRGYNRSSVKDCGHILEDIYRGTLVSENASAQMLSLLKKQTRKSKIPAGLPSGVKSANKTGEVGGEQHDSAIVFSKNADYILVIMTNNDGSSISHIRQVSRAVYDYFN